MYSAGIHVNSSQAKALVYYMFAALGGDVKAQMALVSIFFKLDRQTVIRQMGRETNTCKTEGQSSRYTVIKFGQKMDGQNSSLIDKLK